MTKKNHDFHVFRNIKSFLYANRQYKLLFFFIEIFIEHNLNQIHNINHFML